VDRVTEYLPYILGVLPFVLGVVALAVQGRLKGFVRETVAAVYRVAIRSADALQDEGITWPHSEAGIAYRKQLVGDAYDLFSATIRGLNAKMRWCGGSVMSPSSTPARNVNVYGSSFICRGAL
jgi:hypothetical protein